MVPTSMSKTRFVRRKLHVHTYLYITTNYIHTVLLANCIYSPLSLCHYIEPPIDWQDSSGKCICTWKHRDHRHSCGSQGGGVSALTILSVRAVMRHTIVVWILLRRQRKDGPTSTVRKRGHWQQHICEQKQQLSIHQ